MTVVRWSGEDSWFVAVLPGAHEVSIDEPPPIGGGRGGRPTDLLLAAAASCSGISAVSLFRKMRQPVERLEIFATGNRQTDWPRAFTSILLRFEVLGGRGTDPELIRKAVDMAVRKYCPVSATIELGTGGCRIDYEINLARNGDASVRLEPSV